MKIAAVLPESLGDFILTTPSLKTLEENYPYDQITWILDDKLKEISNMIKLKATRTFVSELADATSIDLDLTICFPPATKHYLRVYRIGGEKRLGYVHENMWIPRMISSFCLTNRWICPHNAPIHELTAYGKILEMIPVKFNPSFPNIEITENKFTNFEFAKTFISLHLNARWTQNPLPFLHDFLLQNPRIALLVLYDKAEESAAQAFLTAHPHEQVFIEGPQTLAAYMTLVKQSKLFIGVDGGGIHFASLLNKPTVAFYSAKDFEFRLAKWHPWQVPYRALPLTPEGLAKLSDTLRTFLNETPSQSRG